MNIKALSTYRPLMDQKQYLKLIAANMISRFGDSIDAIAFSWIMYEVTGNASLIALIMALNFLPNVILQPLAGALVDRCSKKKMMILCDVGRAATVIFTAVAYLMGWLSPGLLIVITLLNSSLESFRMPAGNAIVPLILEKEKYDMGIGLNQAASRISEIIGMACAGGIVALLGSPVALLIDAVTFAISAVIIGLIRYSEKLETAMLTLRSYGKTLIDGFRYLKANRLIFVLSIVGALMNLTTSPFMNFQTIYVGDILLMGPEVLSLLGILMTSGMALGSLLTPILRKHMSGKRLLVIGNIPFILLYSGMYFLLFLPQGWIQLLVLCLLIVIAGVGNGTTNVVFGSAFMSSVEPELMGRISAILNAVLTCTVPLSSLLCSAAAAIFTVPQIMLGAAVLMIPLYVWVGSSKQLNEI